MAQRGAEQLMAFDSIGASSTFAHAYFVLARLMLSRKVALYSKGRHKW